MAGQTEIEELQLVLELEICGLSMEELVQVAEHVDVDTEGLCKLQLSKRVLEKIKKDLVESDDKKTLLEGLIKVVVWKPPHLKAKRKMPLWKLFRLLKFSREQRQSQSQSQSKRFR